MKIKKEVRELCLKMVNNPVASKEWKEASETLQKKYKFTPFNLLALYGANSTIECNDANFSLVMEEVAEK
jgi:hypothetical protein